MKRRLAAAFCLLVLITVFQGMACERAYAFTLNDSSGAAEDNHGLKYTFDADAGALTISYISYPASIDEAYRSSFEGQPDSELVVPAEINGVAVRAVSDTGDYRQQFSTDFPLKTYTLPASVEHLNIGVNLCLEEVRFPDGCNLTEIQAVCRARSPQLLEHRSGSDLKRFNAGDVGGEHFDCRLPEGLKVLGISSFWGAQFESVYVPSSLEVSGSGSYDYTADTKVAFANLPKLVKAVNDSDIWVSFADAPLLEDIRSRALVTGEAPEAYRGDASLKRIELPSGLEKIPYRAFEGCSSLEEVVVPESVKAVEGRAFQSCTSLKSIELPAGLERIGAGAFHGCTALEDVAYEGNVLQSIGYGAFNGTSALKAFSVPDSVTHMGVGMFAHSGVESVHIPANLWQGMAHSDFNRDPACWTITANGRTTWGANLFSNSDNGSIGCGIAELMHTEYRNYAVKELDLMSYRQSFIPYYMFAGLEGLAEVRVPAAVEDVYEGAFADCTNLKKAYFYGDNVSLSMTGSSSSTGSGAEGGWKEYYPGVFGYHARPDSDVVSDANYYSMIPGIKIYGSGFEQNDLITYAKKCGYEFVPFAFLGDGGKADEVKELFGYEMPANKVVASDVEVSGVPSFSLVYDDEGIERTLVPGEDCTVTYKDSMGKTVESLDHNGMFTASITGDGDSVWGTADVQVKVGTGVEPSSSPLVVPGNTPRTDDKAAAEKAAAEKAAAEKAAAEKAAAEKAAAEAAKAASTGEGVKATAGSARVTADVSGGEATLTKVDSASGAIAVDAVTTADGTKVPVTEIAAGAFAGTEVTSVAVGDSVQKIDAGAFQGAKELKSVTVGAGTTTIGKSAFAGCAALATVKLGKSVKTIGAGAFSGCKALKSVSVPAATTSVGKNAFNGCKKLKSVTLGKSLKSVGKNAFKGCKKLKTVTLKTSKLPKSSVKNMLKGSKVKTLKLKGVSKKAKKKYKKWAKAYGVKVK